MKKKSVALVAIMLVISLCTSLANASIAQPQASEYLSRYYAILLPGDEPGQLILSFSITATGNMSSLGIAEFKIYEANGTYVKTIRGSVSNGLLARETYTYSNDYPFTLTSGVSYYAEVTISAISGSTGGSRTITTGTVKAP